jgi:zinc transport system substrate-binding protein
MDYIEPIHAEIQEDWSGDGYDHDHVHDDEDEDEHGHGGAHDGHDHSADEHIWTSVRNVMAMSEAICDVFSSFDSDGAEYYSARLEDYIQRLSLLDSELESIFDGKHSPLAVIADRFPFV